MSEAIRVLLVDDDALQLELVQRTLSRDGFEVEVATSAAEIANVTKRFEPHAVLLDVNVPDAPKGAALEIARAAAAPGTRFFLFSAEDESKLRALAQALRADGWFSKSLPAFELGRKIKDALRR